LGYRSHIDGLRAIAVLGVVLFHFRATWLPGGFTGVDVFYVISGFLISKRLYTELDQGRCSIGAFYEGRARRILPALLVITALAAIPAWLLLFPGPLVDFARSVVAALTFNANVYYYATTSYFGPAANEIPLLHYWSLGVEQQFYLLFPLVLILAHRASRRAVPWVFAGLLVASLAGSTIVLGRDPAAAFYLLPFRAFELLMGSMLALPGVPLPQTPVLRGSATLLGLVLTLGAMLGMSEATPFPGFAALVPCAGATLILWGGEGPATLVTRLLGVRPLVIIGLISYSLYLVHWPIAVFAPMAIPAIKGSRVLLVGGTAASILLALLSWRFVEQPVRTNRRVFTRPALAFGAAGLTAALLALAVTTISGDGFPAWLDVAANRMLTYQKYDYAPIFRQGECFLRPEQRATELNLVACYPDGTDVILFGNSYLAHFYAGLRPLLAERGLTLGMLAGSACRTLPGVETSRRPNCRELFDISLKAILTRPPAVVVLGGHHVADADNNALLDQLVDQLAAAGIRVVVLGPVPVFSGSVPAILAKRIRNGNPTLLSGADLEGRTRAIDDVLKAHFTGRKSVTYVSILAAVCPDDQCPLGAGRVPYHFDQVHLTREGSAHYAARLVDWLLP
jgi:peptidoglycan/LPS O-acetylase OafA/YrhL